ncbi:MAG TPA: hypothetical protein VHF00_04230 [Acidimicrobiales bacterium]|nr:hypothetical protein [Acidimicrobiales bacterium]
MKASRVPAVVAVVTLVAALAGPLSPARAQSRDRDDGHHGGDP